MKLEIPIRALSVNQAWAGRRFRSAKYKQFEKDFCKVVSFNPDPPPEGELFIKYVFFIKNYAAADVDNLIKQTNDMLCKRGFLKDDRYIKAILCIKERAKTVLEEKILTDIVSFRDSMSLMDVR